MDTDKKKVLESINYTLFKCCGLCRYGDFKSGKMFGDCTKFEYDHQKHTDSNRPLSINAFGGCESFQLSANKETQLHRFIDFLK